MKILSFLFLAVFTLNSFGVSYRLAESSKLKWTGKKVTGKHWGTVDFSEGRVELKEGNLVGGRFTVDMASISSLDLTGSSKKNLDNHLKSQDFFSVDTYKNATLVITKAEKKTGNNYQVTGQFTVRGNTHEETFNIIVTQEGEKIRGKGKLVFDRTKYNIKYNSGNFFKDLGDKLIYDEVELEFDIIGEKSDKES